MIVWREERRSLYAVLLSVATAGGWWLTLLVAFRIAFGAAAFPLIFVLPLSYWCAAFWLNRTELRLGNDAVSITHRPLPWFGRRTVPGSEMITVGVRHVDEGRSLPHYRVFARDEEDERFTIVQYLSRASANRIADGLAAWLSRRARAQKSSISPSETGGTSHS